jgi:hypothetical protein
MVLLRWLTVPFSGIGSAILILLDKTLSRAEAFASNKRTAVVSKPSVNQPEGREQVVCLAPPALLAHSRARLVTGPTCRRQPRRAQRAGGEWVRTLDVRRTTPQFCGPKFIDTGAHSCSDRWCSVRAFDDSTARRSAAAASRQGPPDASRAGWRLRQSHYRLRRSLQPGWPPSPSCYLERKNRGAVIQALPRGRLKRK